MKNSSTCYIVGAGDFSEFCLPDDNDFLIAADGGFTALKSAGLTPDILIGDLDSLDNRPEYLRTLKYPPEKDSTDTELAVDYAIARGYREFIINGGCGGRLDHTLANIQLLIKIAKSGGRGYLVGDDFAITAINNATFTLCGDARGYVSVFCFDRDARGVYETGLKYTLDNATLSSGSALGVSNEAVGKNAVIRVDDGCLVIMFHADVRKTAKLNR